jgi:hypothetical protein
LELLKFGEFRESKIPRIETAVSGILVAFLTLHFCNHDPNVGFASISSKNRKLFLKKEIAQIIPRHRAEKDRKIVACQLI